MVPNYLSDEIQEVPTELELTVGLFSKTATMQEVGAAKSLSVRMSWSIFATVKAMSEYSGLSMNRTVLQLMRAGIEAVGEALPDADGRAIAEIKHRVLQELADAEHDGLQLED